jgi:hypothetical protein
MSAIAKLIERLSALEEEVKVLRSAPLPIAPAPISLETFTAALKTASPEEIKEWMAVCQEIAGPLASAPESSEKPKKVTNVTGPSQWNVFIHDTWISMGADAGIMLDDFQGDEDTKDKAFKKEAAKAGITYQAAMKEASRRKALLEGKDPEAPKTKKVKEVKTKEKKPTLAELQAKVAAARAASASASSPMVGGGAQPATQPKTQPKAQPVAVEAEEESQSEEEAQSEPEDDSEDGRAMKEALEMGWVKMMIKGTLHFVDHEAKEAYAFPGLNAVGSYKDGVFQPYF